jgi:hypothetical protein
VVSLDLAMPYYGIPVADVGLAAGALLTSPVTLRAGNLTVTMAVATLPDGSPAQTSFAGSTTARLVGGVGAWGKTVTLTPYNSPAGVLLSKVLGDLASATGERVSLATVLDRSLGVLYVPGPPGPASRLLAVLAGALWWVGVDGVTRVAASRTATTVGSVAQVTMLDGGKGWASVATEDPAAWLPGARYTDATAPKGITVAASRFRAGNDGVLRVEALLQ